MMPVPNLHRLIHSCNSDNRYSNLASIIQYYLAAFSCFGVSIIPVKYVSVLSNKNIILGFPPKYCSIFLTVRHNDAICLRSNVLISA
jgi:hypothetical protein